MILFDTGNRRHPRKRWHEMDEEFQPPRKRQRRFENVRFNVEQIKRSKVVVMNEFLKTLITPNITRQAAKKLESSHQEKQYMLDLACEEVRKNIDLKIQHQQQYVMPCFVIVFMW